ncbi:MAG TPA: hypothetical protein VK324_18295 [Tepidisphaeraceae bacterium]|nr:hypothetical protein [Tepidisphaeraceae bacterium]
MYRLAGVGPAVPLPVVRRLLADVCVSPAAAHGLDVPDLVTVLALVLGYWNARQFLVSLYAAAGAGGGR